MTLPSTSRSPRRARRAARAALALLLALLWLGTTAVAATHHHPRAGDACQACHAAHAAALTRPAPLPGPTFSGRAPHDVRDPQATVVAVDLRVRGPPSPGGAA